jgi:hypothetical protein
VADQLKTEIAPNAMKKIKNAMPSQVTTRGEAPLRFAAG